MASERKVGEPEVPVEVAERPEEHRERAGRPALEEQVDAGVAAGSDRGIDGPAEEDLPDWSPSKSWVPRPSSWSPPAGAVHDPRSGQEFVSLLSAVHDKDLEVKALRGSTSWRITAPIRRVLDRLRGKGQPR